MRILVAGNSQAGALHLAIQDNLVTLDDDFEVDFYVVPGGTGPNFAVRKGKLEVSHFNEKFPPRMDPADTAERPICDYDAILISALGYVDGGFLYQNPIVWQGLVAEFGPKRNNRVSRLISQACLMEVVKYGLLTHPGLHFAGKLREYYSGRIIIQPFPYLSEYMLLREDWVLKDLYEDYLGFNRFLATARYDVLAKLCKEWGAELLTYPDVSYEETGFTPRHLMNDSDGVHPLAGYGAMVMLQVIAHLSELGRAVRPDSDEPSKALSG